jgi:hypothetical protein
VAEVDLSVLARQCLDRRIPDIETLRGRSEPGNGPETQWGQGGVVFSTVDARVKLKNLYPSLELQ